jgi:hypothetical protein
MNGRRELIFGILKRDDNKVLAWKKKVDILWDGLAMKGIYYNFEKSQEQRKNMLELVDISLNLSMPTLKSTRERDF